MGDTNNNDTENILNIRYLGRLGQIRVYFGKMMRMFIYQSDWITIPMAALIAGLVALALGQDFGKTKEGTLMGVFALMCVCLWNGTFNSIQIICRERDVIKREHRSGLYISSYIMAHMLYQAFICAVQVVITILTAYVVGMRITGAGMFTPFLVVDMGITLFLVTYAADMLALFISAVVRTTTVAMTVMPFVLIFQMVFSGGLFPLPDNISFLTVVTVSSPAFDSLASQMDTNNLEYKAVTDMFNALENTQMDVHIKGSEIIDALSNEDDESIKEIRAIRVGGSTTLGEACNMLLTDDKFSKLRNKTVIKRFTIGNVLDEIAKSDDPKIAELRATTLEGDISVRDAIEYILTKDSLAAFRNEQLVFGITIGDVLNSILYLSNDVSIINDGLNTRFEASTNVGDVIDFIRGNEKFSYLYDMTVMGDTSFGEALKMLMKTDNFRDSLDTDLSYYTTIGEVVDYLNNNEAGDEYKNKDIVYHVNFKDAINKLGKDDIMKVISNSSSSVLFTADYEHSKMNVFIDWLMLLALIFVNSIAAMIALSFIDKDKR